MNNFEYIDDSNVKIIKQLVDIETNLPVKQNINDIIYVIDTISLKQILNLFPNQEEFLTEIPICSNYKINKTVFLFYLYSRTITEYNHMILNNFNIKDHLLSEITPTC